MVHDTTQQFPHGFTLMIDNYDSFTHNIYQYLEQSGAHVKVVRNDEISLDDLDAYLQAGQLKNIVISPGPGHPRHESGISRQAILWAFGKVPLLGICMGLECLVDVLGGEIEYAGEIVHGKTSLVTHDGRGLFRSLPQNLKSVRYHSLATKVLNLPAELQVTSTTTQSGVVMGVRHRVYTVEAVQYHPESVLSEGGMELIKNFLDMHGGKWSDCPEFGIGSDIDGIDTPKLVKQVDQQTHGEDVKVEPTPAGAPASASSSSSSPPLSSTATLTPAPTPAPAPAPLPTILTQIHAQRLLDVDSASSHLSTTPAQLKTHLSLELAPPLIPLVPRLLQSAPLPAILAEVKRASPSKGEIAPDTNAPSQALLYAHAGASVISVLTEPTWFKGSLVDMLAVRTALGELPNRPAVLRKDFVLSTYQIDEARFYGADTVLLIVAMLTPQLLAELYAHSVALGMEPLVEVNNAAELERALELGAKVLGVNNRNLHNFEVDMSTTSRMNDVLKRTSRQDKPIMIALSGIAGRQDVLGYLDEGVQGLLVGESLMRAKDPKLFIQQLLDLPTDVHPSSSSSSSSSSSLLPNGSSSSSPTPTPSAPLVKICGIRSTADAQIAISAGADMLGMIFVENSKRQVSVQTAYQIAQLVRFARYANPPAASSSSTTPSPSKPKGWFTHHADVLSASRKPVLVGVFQDQPLAHILSVVSEVGLDLVQLHGHEPAEWASFIPVPVIRVHHVQTSSSSSSSSPSSTSTSSPSSPNKPIISPADVTRTGLNKHILLDAGLSGGGTGETFDWSVARDLVESARETGGSALPIILAGGLTEENVEQAVKAVRPWCVDVSSGVELKETGAVGKDWARCKAFVDRAKRA